MAPEESTGRGWPIQKEPFGHLLRDHRHQRGLSQGELGVTVGHDYTYISKLEAGTLLPRDPDDVLRLVVALGLTATEADELLRSAPRFSNIRFGSTAAPFTPSEEQKEANWLNMLTSLVRVYALERKESADAIGTHLAVFAGVPVLVAFILDPSNQQEARRLKRILVELAARDVRTAALMTLRNVVIRPAKLDDYERRKHRLELSLVEALAKIDASKVDLAIRDIYSASLTQSQREALRAFRVAIEKRAPGLLTIELPSL